MTDSFRKNSTTSSLPVEWPTKLDSLEAFLDELGSKPLLDLLQDGIVIIDARNKVRMINSKAREILQVSEQEAVGQYCFDVIKTQMCHELSGQCRHAKGPFFRESFNVDVSTHQGNVVVCCIHTTSIQDREGNCIGYIEHFREMGQVRDIINQQAELLKLYSNEKEKVQTLIDSIADGVFTLGRDSRLRSFSKRLEELTGWSEKELLGRSYTEILQSPEPGTEIALPLQSGIEKGLEARNLRSHILTATGEAVPVLLNMIPLKDQSSDIIGLMGIVKDLRELECLKKELADRYSFDNIIGSGSKMQEIFDLIERISDTNTNVLIQGESGTGKELVARALHFHSPRRAKPLVKINCSALPDPLLESELFGYEKGAFTGATHRKPGKFKLADGGTIFLDEIGDTSAAFQAKLLRVVQDLEFEPLGGISVEKVDVRILAATNKNLEEEVKSGRFREDLYYRLCVVPIHLPPLRKRKEDIPHLIDHFLEKVRKKYPAKTLGDLRFSPEALSLMLDYEWPGNIRELENTVERAFVCSTAEILDPSVLPRAIRYQELLFSLAEESRTPSSSIRRDDAEKIQDTLRQCKGNKAQAARELGISRTTLWRRLREIDP